MNKFLSIAVFLMLLLTGISLLTTQENQRPQALENGQGEADIGGHFILINQEGKPTSDSDFTGKFMLVFFGFTHCPDECPLTMATYTAALEVLGKDANQFAPIFLSIDPKRDTPARLKEFLSHFDAHIIGLTGSKKEVDAVASEYKVYASEHALDKKSAAKEGDYAVDHSTFIYVMDKNGKYLTHFAYDIAPEELTKQLKALVQK